MNLATFPFLTALIVIPILGAAVVPFISRKKSGLIKTWALVVALAELGVAAAMLFWFQTGTPAMQFAEAAPWIPALGIGYSVGVDGISVLLVALTALLTPVAIAASWKEIGQPRQGVRCAAPAAGGRGHRRLRCARPGAVLRLLGSHVDPDVPADRDLRGRETRAARR